MELEVRVVVGIKSCFVSLPLSLIYVLQSGARNGVLPPLLALELRSLPGDARWNVAWAGSASPSPAIEVPKQLAECISLPHRTVVQVKVTSNLPKAAAVSIEPCTEDDWEILELNSDLAEDVFLKQVGVVHEGMKFPLWLHGHMIVKFVVLTTSPKQTVVRLVPGTEVIVAPKLRRKAIDTCQDCAEISSKEHHQARSLLRVQEDHKRVIHKVDFLGVELRVGLTTAIFMHPETAMGLSFSNLQLVHVLPKPHEDHTQNVPSRRHTIVRLLYSNSVARGHVLIPHTLCLFLMTRVHSWVYVKKIDRTLRKDVSTLTLSPCQFKLLGNSRESDDSNSLKNLKNKDYSSNSALEPSADVPNLSHHDKILSSLHGVSLNNSGESASKSNAKQKQYLIHAWVTGQLKAITLLSGVDVNSVVLVEETLLHFEVINTNKGNITCKDPIDVCFVLFSQFEESSVAGWDFGFVLSSETEKISSNGYKGTDLDIGIVDSGEPISLNFDLYNSSYRKYGSTISSLNWLKIPSSDAINRLTILLSPRFGRLLSARQLPLPGHVLIYGPPGCGKTSMAIAIAKYFEEHEEILAHIIFISCSKIALEKSQTIRQSLITHLSEALAHSPCLIIFDDLDRIVSSSSEMEGSQPSNSVLQLAGFLMDVMDEYGEKRQNTCGLGPIAFMASVRSFENLPQSLTSSGRFDFHIQLSAPGATERSAILKHEIEKRSIECPAEILSDIASKCDGYDAYDLEILVDRAVHASIGRYLSSCAPIKENRRHILTKDEFLQAMQDFTPVAMRGISKKIPHGGHGGWEDVGGLADIRRTIQEMIEMPSKFSSVFAKAPLRLRSNILLYGPPGCGKTHIVGAAAAACSLRFISIKGPELLNKYIGASEQAVRDLFSKAAAAAPCLLFFDEFDSIAPKRGHDNTGVTDRVVNQFLTELDGVEALTGVFVFAATSRPDLLDAALLRPGRLDRLLFCDFPSRHDRLDILKVLSRKLPLASDANLEAIASMTEGFSGADLQSLLSDSELASVHEFLENADSSKSEDAPVISDALLRSVALKARPSVSTSEKQRLYAIYNQFLDSKRSVNAQLRDAKGKRATLA